MSTTLVLGNYRTTLVVFRSLAAAGETIVLGTCGNTHGNERSRHVAESWPHPDFDADDAAFGQALNAFLARRRDIRRIVPVTEEAVVHFARRRYDLPDGICVAATRPDLVEMCQSKDKSLAVAAAVGVPAGRHEVAADIDSLTRSAADIGFPCIVRPLVAPARLFGRKALIVRSAAGLAAAIPNWPREHARLLVQKYNPGPRQNLYFAAAGGEPKCCVQVNILRTDRADGTGLAVEGITVALDDRLDGYCRKMLRALDYTGVGCAQFLVDPDSGDVTFIEINPRLGANCAIVEYCGVDLPRCAWQLAEGRSIEDCALPVSYPTGRRYAWIYGDLAGLVHEIRAREIGPGETLRWLGRMSTNAVRAHVHLTFSWRDPKPALAHIVYVCRQRLSRRPPGTGSVAADTSDLETAHSQSSDAD